MDKEMKNTGIRLMMSILVFIVALFVPDIPYIKFILFLIAYLIVGFYTIKEAIENILHGEWLDEAFLMFIATVGALMTGEYPEAVMVMWLYEVGESFQEYASDKSRKSITELMNIKPEYANIEKDGALQEVSPDKVAIGDIIIIKPGEKIPLDGIVIEGNTELDTSSLTGESALQKVKKGDECYSGTINKTHMIKLQVTKKYEDSTVNKILELVENAANKKAKAENFITKFAKYYTPFVVFSALLIAFLPPLFLKNASFMDYLHRACSFLVISCPCALVISVPLSFFSGLGGASKNGILIKGSNYLETLSKIKTVVLDKTGTLTKGSFEVIQITPQSISQEELLKMAAYAENYSEHPIAQSIKKAYGQEINGDLVSESKEIAGQGIEVKVENHIVHVGNAKLMHTIQANFKEIDEVGTIVYLAIDHQYAGYLVIADKIKAEAKEALERLQAAKIHTVMLTGDNQKVAHFVATELQINEVYAELLPQHKVQEIEKFLATPSQYGKVAFVGDGINDAPVLTRADIGIAMGGLGSDAAIEAADVVIMDDDITKIMKSIQIAKKTMRIVKQNICFSLIVKFAVLIASAFGISNMWQAVFADVGVSFLAILNSMRAFRVNNVKKVSKKDALF